MLLLPKKKILPKKKNTTKGRKSVMDPTTLRKSQSTSPSPQKHGSMGLAETFRNAEIKGDLKRGNEAKRNKRHTAGEKFLEEIQDDSRVTRTKFNEEGLSEKEAREARLGRATQSKKLLQAATRASIATQRLKQGGPAFNKSTSEKAALLKLIAEDSTALEDVMTGVRPLVKAATKDSRTLAQHVPHQNFRPVPSIQHTHDKQFTDARKSVMASVQGAANETQLAGQALLISQPEQPQRRLSAQYKQQLLNDDRFFNPGRHQSPRERLTLTQGDEIALDVLALDDKAAKRESKVSFS